MLIFYNEAFNLGSRVTVVPMFVPAMAIISFSGGMGKKVGSLWTSEIKQSADNEELKENLTNKFYYRVIWPMFYVLLFLSPFFYLKLYVVPTYFSFVEEVKQDYWGCDFYPGYPHAYYEFKSWVFSRNPKD